ncbi:MAG: acyl-CoA thioesterase [Burkholderiales bacterium]|jgi:acyl-CoA thioester hydrolase|nr:acyl-CoA thioesterase [Burkholderiales bacterium]
MNSQRLNRNEVNSRWKSDTTLKVQFYDLDPMNIVWHGHYARYLEVARCALLNSIAYGYDEMRASGYAWPVIDMRLRYVAPATFGQSLNIRAAIVEWEHRLKIDYLITDAATGKRINRASTTQVAVDAATGEMCFISPPVLFEKLGLPFPVETP